jgi:hypothetical protein
MKTYLSPIALLALILLFPCCSQNNETEKTEAKTIFTACSPTTEIFLQELDKNGYSYLNTLKLTDLARKSITEKHEAELQDFIINSETTYGKVKERKFVGAHFWLHKSLLTYFPDYDKKVLNRFGLSEAKDGFYRINPRFMGLNRSSDMFKTFPEGDYVIFMYQVIPTNKAVAEEMVILGQDKNHTWQVVSYEISDDI